MELSCDRYHQSFGISSKHFRISLVQDPTIEYAIEMNV